MLLFSHFTGEKTGAQEDERSFPRTHRERETFGIESQAVWLPSKAHCLEEEARYLLKKNVMNHRREKAIKGTVSGLTI